MPPPKTGPCGGVGQPACPPVPTVTEEPAQYTFSDMYHHGLLNYQKGRVDAKVEYLSHPADEPSLEQVIDFQKKSGQV